MTFTLVTKFQNVKLWGVTQVTFYHNHITYLDAKQNGDPAISHELSKFILVKLEYVDDDRPSAILQRSSGFCKVPISWKFNVLVALAEDAEVR